MALKVGSTTILTTLGAIKVGSTNITKVNVIKDGVTTSVWEVISSLKVYEATHSMTAGYFKYNNPTVTTNNETYVTCECILGNTQGTVNIQGELVTFKAPCKNYKYAKVTLAYGYYSNYGDFKITYTLPGGSAVSLIDKAYSDGQSGGILTKTFTIDTSTLASDGTSTLRGTLYLYNRSSNSVYWVNGGIGIQKIELTNTA